MFAERLDCWQSGWGDATRYLPRTGSTESGEQIRQPTAMIVVYGAAGRGVLAAAVGLLCAALGPDTILSGLTSFLARSGRWVAPVC